MDEKSGGCKDSKLIDDKDKCGATGMEQLNILPAKCKTFLFDMGIFTASIFLSNEVGEFSTKFQAWHKQTSEKSKC
jgi:hypothetical protein